MLTNGLKARKRLKSALVAVALLTAVTLFLPTRCKAQSISLTAVGDVMMGRGVEEKCLKYGWDYPFQNIGPILHASDIAFGNLECVVSSQGERMSRAITLRANPACLPALKRAGFTLMSVANNHAMDYGRAAFADTLHGLKGQSIQPVGGGETYDAAAAGTVMVKNGIRVGIVGFSAFPNVAGPYAPLEPSIAILSDERLVQSVRDLKKRSDVVIVSCHWGIEGYTHHAPMQERLAHLAIDSGADLVLGHHPHVAQEIEKYHNGVIVYSLGNCVFDSRSRGGNAGLLFRCTITAHGVTAYGAKPLSIKDCRPTPAVAKVASNGQPASASAKK